MARVEIDVPGAVLDGHRAGTGRPAPLLHGGAAIPDYMGGCATALDGLVEHFALVWPRYFAAGRR